MNIKKKIFWIGLLALFFLTINFNSVSAPEGWNTSRQLNIIANSSSSIPAGYSFNMTLNLNLTNLVNNGNLQSDFDDFRVRINNSIDIPIRVDYTTGASNFSLYFNLSHEIPAGQNYTDLDLFYGNPNAVRFSLHNNTRTLDYQFNDDGNLLIYYSFDVADKNVVNDTAGKIGHNLESVDSGLFTNGTGCKFGNCINVTGSSGNTWFNDTDITDIENNPLTIDFWAADDNQDSNVWVFGFTSEVSPDREHLIMGNSGSRFGAIINVDGSSGSNIQSNNVAPTQLTHYRYIIGNSSRGIELFFNQTSIGTNSTNLGIGDEHTHTRIGRIRGTTEVWDGRIDDFYVWNADVGTPIQLAGDLPTFRMGEPEDASNVPTTPILKFPANRSLLTSDSNIKLQWFNSSDGDGDAITYVVQVYNDSSLTELAYINGSVTEQGINQTNVTIPNSLFNGDYFWRVLATDGTLNSSWSNTYNFTIDSSNLKTEISSFNNSVAESSQEIFTTNITYNRHLFSDVTARLVYNGTTHTSTKILDNNGTKRFQSSITIPQTTIDTTMQFFWNFTLTNINGSLTHNTTSNYNQNVNFTNFTIRDGIVTHPYINFIFRDESTNSLISASVAESTFQYSPQADLQPNKTFTYSNTTENSFYNFSFRPSYQPITAKISFTYEAGSYPARTYEETLSLSNITTIKELFLLNEGNGSFVTFQVINEADQPLKDVKIVVTRNSNTIETKSTDAAGAATFFLDPDLSYTFTFTKSGFETFSTTLVPTQSAYTITLTSTAKVNTTAFFEGVTWDILPKNDTLQNGTTYNFSLSVSSNFRQLDLAGFILENGSGVFLNSTSCSGTSGCSASILTNTANHTRINMNWFIEINGTRLNSTTSWEVFAQYEGVGALSRFFSDLDKLGNGFNPFTKGMLAFFFILSITAIVSSVAGLTSPTAIFGVLFGMTAVMDAGNLLPTIPNAPFGDFLITIIIGLIWLGFMAWEFGRG